MAKFLRAANLVDDAADLLKRGAKRWGDNIPIDFLADICSACLAIATERLEDAERMLALIGERIGEPE